MATQDDERLEVLVPTQRPDVTRPVDLVEEVARLHGYDRFPSRVTMGPDGTVSPDQRRAFGAEALVGSGYFEAQSMSFFGVGELDLMRLPTDGAKKICDRVANPLREGESLLRTTLLPGLLKAAGNLDRGWRDVALFEIGKSSTHRRCSTSSSRSARPSGLRRRGRAGQLGDPRGPARCRRPRGDRAGEAAG